MLNASPTPDAPDLGRDFPRSPAQELGGYVYLARIIDKCRATIAQTHGEYIYNCPMDRQFFDFTSIDSAELKAFIAGNASDEAIVDWVREHSAPHSDMEILTWCYEQRTREPRTAVEKAFYERLRRKACPTRVHLRTWMEILDAEEGRI